MSTKFGFAVSVHVAYLRPRPCEPDVRAQNASIIALMEPASAVVFAAIILSQQITSSVLVGGGLILLECSGGQWGGSDGGCA